MNITWNADKYTSDFSFVHQYGNSVTELIDAKEGSTVLDLGCGNGALSEILRDKGYIVTGMDDSKDLLAVAEKNFPNIPFIRADATDFSLPEPVDVVFSNAVFHWIDKERQPEMLRCVYNALKERGQFVFEFGGHGNNFMIHEALAESFRRHGYAYKMPFYFPTVGEYSALLENAGFQVTFAALFDRPTKLRGENGLKEWIEMFVQTPFDAVEKESERECIKDEAVDRLRNSLYQNGDWYADYVRIRMKAIRL